ncbi:DUF4468 domain-containing protein [Pedobacter zeae]|uniref:DUF4468 domain-containing protein n=1 Tax=Pedobacter zeae TaxID=1737356 RepID=A0A7W6P7V9_9SPHI|nr:DUF4468 domain-containing protein [Pedobacter zeae]MBB4110647.1 hypothetical protein [Pedobacter zeae]GGH19124.1 hypothetical protein GCM10007422_43760 [Pedobacter zeae]
MKYILLILLITISIDLSAQQKQFAKDDNGNFIYYQVVDSQSLSKDTLLQRAKSFVNVVQKKTMKAESITDTSVLAKGTMIIDKTILVVGHPSGEVSYNFVFEVRKGKYRFWLTDLLFIPYQRDRYGNFVATTKIGVPLERTPGKLGAGAWKDIVNSTYTKIEKFGEDFKRYLATDRVEKAKKRTETISTKKWE